MRRTLLPTPAAFAQAQPRRVLGSGSCPVSLLPCSLKGLRELAELLPPHVLEFTVTIMQEPGLLLVLRMMLDLHHPRVSSRLAQPHPLRRASGLALPRGCMGTAGPWQSSPWLWLHLLTLMSAEGSSWQRCPRPCLSVVKGWEPRPGHGVAAPSLAIPCPGLLLLALEAWAMPCGGVAAEKPRWWETHARCCCWEGSMESGSVPACAVVASAVFVILRSPPLYTNKYLPTALCSPCLLGCLLPHPQDEPLSATGPRTLVWLLRDFSHRQGDHAAHWGPWSLCTPAQAACDAWSGGAAGC